MTEDNLRIIRVDLLNQSLKTYRDLNSGDPVRYPVLVLLSRPADAYERIKLANVGIVTNGNDPMQGLIKDTTLEQVRNQLPVLNGRIDMAAREARGEREAAEAEDQRLTALAAEINEGLKP